MKATTIVSLLALTALFCSTNVSAVADTGSSDVLVALPESSNLELYIAEPPVGIFHAGGEGGGSGGASSELSPGSGPTLNLGTFDIVINPNPALAGNAAALAAFNRAALQWENKIADPIVVNINADLAPLGPGILGSTGAVLLGAGYNVIRNPMVADAADEPDDGIVASLPAAAGFSAFVPGGGFGLTGDIVATKANLKALGFANLDAIAGTANDADITFSSNFAFDFDNSNGVTAGQVDFETVAAHEIGHALGFISTVDSVDFLVDTGNPQDVDLFPLDLFRFQVGTANDPATVANFGTFTRSITANSAANTDEIANVWRMSTGVSTGDGNQSSHWRDDAITGLTIGIMDPTLSNGVVTLTGFPDFRAMDLIGYEILIPEPSSLVLMAMGLMGFATIRRQRSR